MLLVFCFALPFFLFHIQADDVKALLSDANVSDDSTSAAPTSASTKNKVASKGLTAAGASLLESEVLPDYHGIGKRAGDGSDKPFRDGSGM